MSSLDTGGEGGTPCVGVECSHERCSNMTSMYKVSSNTRSMYKVRFSSTMTSVNWGVGLISDKKHLGQ